MLTTKKTDLGLELHWKGEVDVDTLEDLTFLIYYRAFSTARESGYPFPARVWNRIPNIYVSYGDIKNYERFCGGRQRAYDILNVDDLGRPMASAVGSESGELGFSFLFSAEPLHFGSSTFEAKILQLENA